MFVHLPGALSSFFMVWDVCTAGRVVAGERELEGTHILGLGSFTLLKRRKNDRKKNEKRSLLIKSQICEFIVCVTRWFMNSMMLCFITYGLKIHRIEISHTVLPHNTWTPDTIRRNRTPGNSYTVLHIYSLAPLANYCIVFFIRLKILPFVLLCSLLPKLRIFTLYYYHCVLVLNSPRFCSITWRCTMTGRWGMGDEWTPGMMPGREDVMHIAV